MLTFLTARCERRKILKRCVALLRASIEMESSPGKRAILRRSESSATWSRISTGWRSERTLFEGCQSR